MTTSAAGKQDKNAAPASKAGSAGAPAGTNMSWWELVKNTYNGYSADKVWRLAASVAFFSMTSLAPLLVIAVAIAGALFGHTAALGQIHSQLVGIFGNSETGKSAADFVEALLKSTHQQSSGVKSSIISSLILFFSATGLFVALQDALNTVWQVKIDPARGWKGMVKDRALTFLMVLLIGAILLASIILTTVISGVGKAMGGALPILIQAINFIVSIGVFAALFAAIFKFLPDAKISWKDTAIGALVTSVLFTLGKWGLGLYLTHGSTTSAYGAAGSMVALLLFIYYSSQILLFGAEFTKVYSLKEGHPIVPSEGSVKVTDQDRAQEGEEKPKDGTAAAKNADPKKEGKSSADAKGFSMPGTPAVSTGGKASHEAEATRRRSPWPRNWLDRVKNEGVRRCSLNAE